MACASNCYGCSKQTALSFLPAWLVPLPSWSQAEFLIWPLCSGAPGGKLCSSGHTGKTKPPAIKWSCWVEQQRDKDLVPAEGQRKQAEVCFAFCASYSSTHNACHCQGPSHVPWGRCCCPPLPGGQSPTCFVPRGGWDRADLEPFALSTQGSMRTSQQFPAGGRAWLGTVGPHKGWAQWQLGELCHLCPQSMRASGQVAGLVGAREGSCNP